MTSTLVLSELVDETIDQLYADIERPRPLALGAALTATATSLSLVAEAEAVAVTDLLEIDSELLLVTAKTYDLNPTYTVIRGYSNTAKTVHDAGAIASLNPFWTRESVTRALRRFFTGVAASNLPLISSELMNTTYVSGLGQQLVPLDEDVIRVLQVRFASLTTGRIVDVPGWRFEPNLPPAVVSSTKGLRVPSNVSPEDDLMVTATRRYRWVVTASGDETIEVTEGSEDIPSLFAACFLASGRMVSRMEADKLVQRDTDTQNRSSMDTAVVRLKWQELYRRFEEAKRNIDIPRPLVYRRFQRG